MPSMPQPLPTPGMRVLALVNQHGSPEEKQLVATHRQTLLRFLDHADTRLWLARHAPLDIGLENRLVLKFNLIAGRRGSPWGLIDAFADWAPALRTLSETVIRHKLHCHAGIKLTPTHAEYELYPYETPDKLLATTVFPGISGEQTGLPTLPYCYGYASDGSLSAYAELEDVPAAELETAMGLSLPTAGLRAKALFHSRRSPEGRWTTDKGGIEFLPFPSHLLNTALNHLDLRFSYLLHRGGRRPYGVIGMKGNRHVLYTTLLPRVAPARPHAS